MKNEAINLTALLVCPKCKGRARCISTPYTHDKYLVMCIEDGCDTYQDKWHDTKEEAISEWKLEEFMEAVIMGVEE